MLVVVFRRTEFVGMHVPDSRCELAIVYMHIHTSILTTLSIDQSDTVAVKRDNADSSGSDSVDTTAFFTNTVHVAKVRTNTQFTRT